MNIDELDVICEGCKRECPDGFCKAYRDARYKILGMKFVDGKSLRGLYEGRWISIKEGAEIAGCDPQTLYYRISRSGMTFTEAIEIGGSKKIRLAAITYCGETKYLADWARYFGVSYNALKNHVVRRNRTLGEALKRIKKKGVKRIEKYS